MQGSTFHCPDVSITQRLATGRAIGQMKGSNNYIAFETVTCGVQAKTENTSTVFLRFSAPGRLPIFEVFGGVLNRAGALIKTYENLDLPFPAHTRILFIIYDN